VVAGLGATPGTTCAMLLREVKMAGAAITVAPVVLRKARLDSLDGESGVLSCVVSLSVFFMISSSLSLL
jgi:hypothetical protein